MFDLLAWHSYGKPIDASGSMILITANGDAISVRDALVLGFLPVGSGLGTAPWPLDHQRLYSFVGSYVLPCVPMFV